MRVSLQSPVNILTASFLLILVKFSNGILNIYLSTQEVQKLLGLEAELFYVRQGVINDYALNFVVPIPSRIHYLHFTWENLGNKPMPYIIRVGTTNGVALEEPKLNITDSGLIPTYNQIFSISLQCTGLISAEIDVSIHINITIASDPISLALKRKKICTKVELHTKKQIVDGVLISDSSAKIFYYAVICAVVLAATSIMCMTGLYVQRNKHRRTIEETTANQTYSAFIPTAIRNPTTSSSYSSFRRMPSYSLIEDRPSPKTLQERITELTIQRCRVCLKNVVLEGTFSRVYHGTYTSEGKAEEDVLVKTVTDHASQIQISLLLQEGMSMYALNHPNILNILGISFEDNAPPFLLYPLHNYSNLKVFLQRCKICSEGVAHTLTTQEVVDMALQVIEATNYMHKKHILHKDLAARNCVVDNKLKIKIADNALSRDLFPSDYHCLGDNENRPVKWLALESLIHKTFSTRSEVWSFGVLLWELTTLAQQPYIEIDPFEMAAYLKDGYRLVQPINCPDELFAVMAYCWAMNPEDRPTFLQLQVCLKEFYMQLTRYV